MPPTTPPGRDDHARDLRQLVSAYAHANLADFLRAGLPVPPGEAVGVAIDHAAGVKIVVFLCAYDGPALLHQPPGAPPLGVPLSPAPSPPADLRDVELAAIQAAGREPASLKQLAARAGYSARGNHFREAVRALIERDLLRRGPRGIYRPG